MEMGNVWLDIINTAVNIVSEDLGLGADEFYPYILGSFHWCWLNQAKKQPIIKQGA